MQLPKSVQTQLRERVDLQSFSSPFCKVMTEFLAPVLFVEEVLLQYATHLQDDNIARADRFSSEDEFACCAIYEDDEILEKMLDKAVERAIARVCTSESIRELAEGYKLPTQTVREKDKSASGFWVALAGMKSTNLALILGTAIIVSLLPTDVVNIEDMKDLVRIIFGAEHRSSGEVVDHLTVQ